MKKVIRIIMSVGILIACAYFAVPGLLRCPTGMINNFEVAEDGKSITLNVISSSSMGYIRNVTIHQQYGGKLYLDCFAAFGGPNGKIGAQDTFTIPLTEDTTVIGLYRDLNTYELVLGKDKHGEWHLLSNMPEADWHDTRYVEI